MMPNWCSNAINIRGDSNTITEIKKLIESIDDSKKAIVFQTLIGLPEGITKEDYENNWYHINIENFGTKWDVSVDGCQFDFTSEQISFYPDTAWSPPIQFCINLSEKFKGPTIDLYYQEPGADISGQVWIKDGHVIQSFNYTFMEGLYKLDNETFWTEIEYEIEINKENNVTIEQFLSKYFYCSAEDIDRIKTFYNN
jgi:hypothetical protein